MDHTIFQLLAPFRPLFSRQASYIWFIVIIFGFLLRFDHHGVSSFVRWLHLSPTNYPLLVNFFHASSWSTSEVMLTWIALCRKKFTLVSLNERLLILGDGIKVSKESQCQPAYAALDLFTEHTHPLHPERTVKLYQRDLYWGADSFFLRFVWGIDQGRQFILMSSDRSLTSLEILKCYGLRFQIEFGFRVLKHIMGGFAYRFWSSLCRPEKTNSKHALTVVDENKQKAIMEKSATHLRRDYF